MFIKNTQRPHNSIRRAITMALIVGSSSSFAAFTSGTSGVYYLDDYNNNTIYEVQGTAVIGSFSTSNFSTGYEGANLAVTNVVTTTSLGSSNGIAGTGGQYTLAGGSISTINSVTLGQETYDGTSNGLYNYTINTITANVIQTDLNWQNPTILFPVAQGDLGISYDSLNNSLWVSGYGISTITDYSMSGAILSSFDTGMLYMAALAFDNTDNTLWFNYNQTGMLYQYDTSGNQLQSGTPTGLPSDGKYLAGEFSTTPEPTAFVLMGLGLAAMMFTRRRPSQRANT